MIKFFRKIRQNLLTENKFSKYLLYAIGEIFLVVVGILIAFQVNNWNEQNKLKVEEKKLLRSFKISLEEDVKSLKYYINEYEKSDLNFDTYLLSDSHGNALGNLTEKINVYNFSAGGDSCFFTFLQ